MPGEPNSRISARFSSNEVMLPEGGLISCRLGQPTALRRPLSPRRNDAGRKPLHRAVWQDTRAARQRARGAAQIMDDPRLNVGQFLIQLHLTP